MLITNKILLRTVNYEDVEPLLAWENDVENWEVSSTTEAFKREEIEFFVASKQTLIKDGQERYMICLENEKNAIGCVDLFDYNPVLKKAGIGILIGEKQFRNKGYARQAICLLAQHLFSSTNVCTIYAEITENNKSSVALFESCSFKFIKINVKEGKSLKYYELNNPNYG